MAFQIIRRHCLRWTYLPFRCFRTSGKRGNIKVALTAIVVLVVFITAVNREERNVFALSEVIDPIDKELKAPVPVRNIQEYVVPNEVKEVPKVKNFTTCERFPPTLVGDMSPNQNITPSFEEVEKVSGPDLLKGGCFVPKSCKPRQKVAIIIPFKDRDAHLKTLMYYLHPMLQRQKAQYCLYVAEQFDNGTFNKAMVMNAAFEEVMKLDSYDCIVFHDVDMIPENDNNLYSCAKHPRHLSPAIDKFRYRPHYGTDFGGVTAITPEQYRKANGHSNEFWGWGGEDNDMEFRIRYNGMKIFAAPMKHGRYKMIFHSHPWKFMQNSSPYQLNKTREARAKVDGLSDLMYRMKETERFSTFTKLMIDIRRIEMKAITLFIDGKPAMSIDVDPGECRWQEYPGKYLDFNIELSEVPEAAHLKPLRMNQKDPHSDLPDHIKAKLPTTTPPVRFSLVDSKSEAISLCKQLAPECQGVQREGSETRYSLRRGNIPRSIVITGAANSQAKNKPDEVVKKKYYFPDKTAFVIYCPGGAGGFIQGYMKPLDVNLDLNVTKIQHTYSFEVYFSVLLQPTKYLYYSDTKQFESQLNKGQNFYTFRWPSSKPPDFRLPDTPRHYKLKTEEFAVPNIPGCYAIQSKILDRRQHPYYQWNWWFEVKSDDKTRDAMAREEFWKKQMAVNIAESKEATQQKAAEEQRKKQEKREYLFKKEMAELRKENFKKDPVIEEAIQKEENKIADKIVPGSHTIIETFDPAQGYPKVKDIQPQPTAEPIAVRQKAFHAGLPKELNRGNSDRVGLT